MKNMLKNLIQMRTNFTAEEATKLKEHIDAHTEYGVEGTPGAIADQVTEAKVADAEWRAAKASLLEDLQDVKIHKSKDHGINGVARQKDIQKLKERVDALELYKYTKENSPLVIGEVRSLSAGLYRFEGEKWSKVGDKS